MTAQELRKSQVQEEVDEYMQYLNEKYKRTAHLSKNDRYDY